MSIVSVSSDLTFVISSLSSVFPSPRSWLGTNGVLMVTKVKSDETETIDLDHLFVNYGFKSSVGNLKNWGLDLNRYKIIVNSKQESSQAGIYAIGDCCYYDGKIDLIATGLGEAPTAVNNAINYIDPEQKVQPKHSTSL